MMVQDWAISLSDKRVGNIASENQAFIEVSDFLQKPEIAIAGAALQKFAKITPQYPGIRAPLDSQVIANWLADLAPMLDQHFGASPQGWEMQAWYSLVTTPARDLIPMQRFPHVDGTDPRQLAMMLYLHSTEHGGTGFYRHKSTGFTELIDTTFPRYRTALQHDVARTGLPPAAYVTDGEPLFERIHATSGAYNQAVFYRGNLLHSGLIDDTAALSPDPSKGRLTINAFFRPKA